MNDLVSKFKKLVDERRLSHAYLLWGNDYDSCLNFALSLANYLENGQWETGGHSQESMVLRAPIKGSIGIDDARSLKNFLWQKPIKSIRRCGIIAGSESMTPDAQNAILKIVEEPPESSLIVLSAMNLDSLLPTLVSRLLKIHLPDRLAAGHSPLAEDFILSPQKRGAIIKTIVENDAALDDFLNSLVWRLRKNIMINWRIIGEILKRQKSMKQFNTNKRLQLESIASFLS